MAGHPRDGRELVEQSRRYPAGGVLGGLAQAGECHRLARVRTQGQGTGHLECRTRREPDSRRKGRGDVTRPTERRAHLFHHTGDVARPGWIDRRRIGHIDGDDRTGRLGVAREHDVRTRGIGRVGDLHRAIDGDRQAQAERGVGVLADEVHPSRSTSDEGGHRRRLDRRDDDAGPVAPRRAPPAAWPQSPRAACR